MSLLFVTFALEEFKDGVASFIITKSFFVSEYLDYMCISYFDGGASSIIASSLSTKPVFRTATANVQQNCSSIHPSCRELYISTIWTVLLVHANTSLEWLLFTSTMDWISKLFFFW